jgi:hypothetical protein
MRGLKTLRCVTVLTVLAILPIIGFCADDLYCDFRDQTQKCVEIVKRCDPGAIEVSSTHNAIIKVGYAYAGKAPVYIKIKDDCPKGQTLLITAEPAAQFKSEQPPVKEQTAEFICGSLVPSKIHFDLSAGSRTFTYYENPKACLPDGCPQEKEKVLKIGSINGR